MNANLAAVLYIVSGVLFILALRGLSSPTTSQAGNRNGMIGMTIAVGTTLATLWSQGALDPLTLGLIVAGVAVGGIIGAIIAKRVAMTSMPQLVAAFHSLVGMAACLVAVAAIHTPAAYGILGADGAIHMQSLIELSLGLAIGAVTFTGSVIAFAKLNGNMSGAPIILPARHLLNIAIGLAIVAMIVVLVLSGGAALWAFWAIFALALVIGVEIVRFALVAAPKALIAALVVLAGAVVGDDAEIMVGELQVVFGLHPVAVVLRVLRQLLVLVEQLGCIAPRAAVDPVALVAAAGLIAVAAAATPVLILIAIVVQRKSVPHSDGTGRVLFARWSAA